MQSKTTKDTPVKNTLHSRNKHQGNYNLRELVMKNPSLDAFIFINKYNTETIDFFNPDGVKELNKALLYNFYNIHFWDIPKGFLCPPIPGRADYIHNVADLLAKSNNGKIPKGEAIKCLDIGVGANCIYPIIGNHEYRWSFIGSDIQKESVSVARFTVRNNKHLEGKIEIRLQENPKFFFQGIIKKSDKIHLTICNPPFHESAEKAFQANHRKMKNLKGKDMEEAELNFSGQSNELWYKGGEKRFIRDMIFKSKHYSNTCLWFTSLVSKESNLRDLEKTCKDVGAKDIEIIEMGQGNKKSRLIAWSFIPQKERNKWF